MEGRFTVVVRVTQDDVNGALWAAVLPHVAPAISSAAASITSHLSHSYTVDLTDLSASCPSPPHPHPQHTPP